MGTSLPKALVEGFATGLNLKGYKSPTSEVWRVNLQLNGTISIGHAKFHSIVRASIWHLMKEDRNLPLSVFYF